MTAELAPVLALSPEKLFYKINEVAQLTGLKPYVLRYWETEFPELSPEKDSSSQRRYRPKDIQVVLAIRKLLYDDRFTIKGARQRLKDELRKLKDAQTSNGHGGRTTVESKAPSIAKAAQVSARVVELHSSSQVMLEDEEMAPALKKIEPKDRDRMLVELKDIRRDVRDVLRMLRA